MFRRCFTSLLVLLMLANQGLCFAHVHHGQDVEEPDGHGLRPHVHLGQHAHHKGECRHGHGSHQHSRSDGAEAPLSSDEQSSESPGNFAPHGDHDSDAVYGGEPLSLARTSNSGSFFPGEDVPAGLAYWQVEDFDDGLLHVQPSGFRPSLLHDDACPVYLRALSLRL